MTRIKKSTGSDGKLVLSNILDKDTGQYIQYKETTGIVDADVDGSVYIKRGIKYFIQSEYLNRGNVLVKGTMALMRATTVKEFILLRIGYYGSIELSGYYDADDGAGGIFTLSPLSVVADNNGTIIKITAVTTGRLIRSVSGELNVNVFGTIPDGVQDCAVRINQAIAFLRLNNANLNSTTLFFPSGRYLLKDSIRLRQAVSLKGSGTLSGIGGGTEFFCDFDSFVPPTDNYVENYSPVLLRKPVIYNTELITQSSLSGFRLNGNFKDVYGLYINALYYTKWDSIFIIKCNFSPLTIIRAQFNEISMLTINENGAAARILMSSTTTINGLDIENVLNTTPDGILHVIHELSTKSGITINNFHYEEVVGGTPAGEWIKLAGRGITFNALFATFSGTSPQRFLETLDTGSAYSFDGVNILTPSSNFLRLKNISTGSGIVVTVRLGLGTTRADIASGFPVVDNSGSDTNRLGVSTFGTGFNILLLGTLTKIFFFLEGVMRFRNLSFSATTGADMSISNRVGRLELTSGDSSGASNLRLNSTVTEIRTRDGLAGTFSEGIARLSGMYMFWSPQDELRFKRTVFSSATDGLALTVKREEKIITTQNYSILTRLDRYNFLRLTNLVTGTLTVLNNIFLENDEVEGLCLGAEMTIVQGTGITVLTDSKSNLKILKGGMFKLRSLGGGTFILSGDLEQSGLNQSNGTYEPIISGTVSSPTTTYTLQSGFWVKTGRVVFFRLRINWSAITGGSGSVRVSLPPFAGDDNSPGSVAIIGQMSGITFTEQVIGNIGTTHINLAENTKAGASSGLECSQFIGGAGSLIISGSYMSA